VIQYAFDLSEGAVRFSTHEDCPFICVEHALDNERHAVGTRSAHDIVAYPYTNASAAPGISIYRQLEPAYVD
jgi:hypothetical protein